LKYTLSVSDPLPPAAALPLTRGRITRRQAAGFIVPLRKGDGRRSRQGVAHTCCLVVFASLWFTFAVQAEVIDKVVAVVDGHVITLSDLRKEQGFRTQLGEKAPDTDVALAKELIDQYLIERQIADYPNIDVTDEEVNAELQKLKISPSDVLRDAVRRRIRMQKFIDVKFRQLIRPTDVEIRKYYEEVFVPEARTRGLQSILPLSDPEMAAAIRDNLIEESVNHELNVWLEATRRRSNIEVLE